MSTILATEGIYSNHNHGCLHSSSSQHRPGTQGTVREYKWAGNRAPRCSFYYHGDFNKANFRTIAPKYFQHVTINTRGDRILDHCYTSFRDPYKSLPRPPFGKSDHSSVLLLPAYRQKLKCEAPRPQDSPMLVGPIGRYTTGLFWSRGLGHVPGSVCVLIAERRH